MKYSVVIPIFNEEESLLILHERLCSAMKDVCEEFQIIYVNDGSTDSSNDIIKEICRNDLSVRLITFKKNYGQDAALAAGLRKACGEVVIAMDGDLQDDPQDIKLFLDEIDKGYDIVCGWRRYRAKRHIFREIIAFMGNKLGRIIFGLSVHDFNATFKAYRRSVIDRLYFFKGSHRFIPVLAAMNNFSLKEIEIKNSSRFSGHSKYNFWGLNRVLKVSKDALLLKTSYCIFNKQPQKILTEVYYEIKEEYE